MPRAAARHERKLAWLQRLRTNTGSLSSTTRSPCAAANLTRFSIRKSSTWLTNFFMACAPFSLCLARAARISHRSSTGLTVRWDRCARAHTDLNAFIAIDADALLQAAKDADKARAAGVEARLLGVPVGIKDSDLTAGLSTSLGLERLAHFVPTEDADAVRDVKDAGALVFGKQPGRDVLWADRA